MESENDNIEDKLDFELEPLVPDTEEEHLDDGEGDNLDEVNPVVAEKLQQLQMELDWLEQFIQLTPTLKNPFLANVGTDGSFTELCLLNGTASAFADGRTGTITTLGTRQAVLLMMRDTTSIGFVEAGGSGTGRASGNYEVRVKQNGVDNDGNPIYDLYDLADVGLTTKLNLSGALPPNNSRARLASGVTPIAVADGSLGEAYTNTDGTIGLETVPETLCSGGLSVSTY